MHGLEQEERMKIEGGCLCGKVRYSGDRAGPAKRSCWRA